MADHGFPSFVLFTDAPPLKSGGHGCHVLAWNWVQMAGPDLKLVVTHRLNPSLQHDAIAADLQSPVFFYPDLSKLRWSRFQFPKSLLEIVLFRLSLPRLLERIRLSGAERIFAFFGGSSWFLFLTRWVALRSRLPLDIYLVDDLEESARLSGQKGLARLTRWLEPRTLKVAERVFTISPGYAEHLERKYGVKARWLPVNIRAAKLTHHAFPGRQGETRTIAFVGAVNELYLGALQDLVKVIGEWNAERNGFKLRLLLLTYTSPAFVERELGRTEHVELCYRAPRPEFDKRLRESWAIFMPYSFSKNVKVMVSTSFPTKLVDSFPVGRPILVYGPDYASVPRFFHENGLPLCFNSLSGLKAAFGEIERHDTPVLVQKYQEVIDRHHSAEHLREILAKR